jgi:hypothetical protein
MSAKVGLVGPGEPSLQQCFLVHFELKVTPVASMVLNELVNENCRP